jgi:hypothetical protein
MWGRKRKLLGKRYRNKNRLGYRTSQRSSANFKRWKRKWLGKKRKKESIRIQDKSLFFLSIQMGGREINGKWRGTRIDQGYRTSNRFLHILRGGRGKIGKGRGKENRSGLVTGQVTVFLPILWRWTRKWLGKEEKKRMGQDRGQVMIVFLF